MPFLAFDIDDTLTTNTTCDDEEYLQCRMTSRSNRANIHKLLDLAEQNSDIKVVINTARTICNSLHEENSNFYEGVDRSIKQRLQQLVKPEDFKCNPESHSQNALERANVKLDYMKEFESQYGNGLLLDDNPINVQTVSTLFHSTLEIDPKTGITNDDVKHVSDFFNSSFIHK